MGQEMTSKRREMLSGMKARLGAAAEGVEPSGVSDSLAANGAGVFGRPGPANSVARAIESSMEAMLAGASAVQEVDVSRIDPPEDSDRLTIEGEKDPEFDSLLESIRQDGQHVPVLLRPKADDRFEIVYGSRRVRAAAALGIKVKSLVRDLSNDEATIAQGIENNERKNTTFIEKAVFCWKREQRGIDRKTIMAAIRVDKGVLSHMATVTTAIPQDVIASIGRAPKVGRRQWVALAQRMSDELLPQQRKLIASEEFQKVFDSDRRFAMVASLGISPRRNKGNAESWTSPNGGAVKLTVRQDGSAVLKLDKKTGPRLAGLLFDQLKEIDVKTKL
jgi:ParB family chromosome partitioning protein